jgi:hypothetical protein
MTRTINISKEDYLKYSSYALKRLWKSKNKSSGFLRNMIVWFFLAIVFMFVFQIKATTFDSFHWPSAAIAIAPFLIIIVVYYLNMRRLKMLCIPNENGLMIGEKTIEVNAEGITETNPLGNCFYRWKAIEAIEEHEGDIYIFVDNLLALILPSESFSSEEEKDQFKGLVKKYV